MNALAKWLMKNDESMGKQAALRKVREAIQAGKKIAVGGSLHVYDSGDDVVKAARSVNPEVRKFLAKSDPEREALSGKARKEVLRRVYLDDILHEKGLAPETHGVFTKRNSYLVQPKMSDEFIPYYTADMLDAKVRSKGFYPGDLTKSNMMRDPLTAEPQVIDSGMFTYPETYGRWEHGTLDHPNRVQVESDRRRARSRMSR